MKTHTHILIALVTIIAAFALGFAALPHKKARKVYVLDGTESLVRYSSIGKL